MRSVVLDAGARRFGPAPTDVRAAIEAMTVTEQLETLLARLLNAANWDELLAR
jgi:hypothetical protein